MPDSDALKHTIIHCAWNIHWTSAQNAVGAQELSRNIIWKHSALHWQVLISSLKLLASVYFLMISASHEENMLIAIDDNIACNNICRCARMTPQHKMNTDLSSRFLTLSRWVISLVSIEQGAGIYMLILKQAAFDGCLMEQAIPADVLNSMFFEKPAATKEQPGAMITPKHYRQPQNIQRLASAGLLYNRGVQETGEGIDYILARTYWIEAVRGNLVASSQSALVKPIISI